MNGVLIRVLVLSLVAGTASAGTAYVSSTDFHAGMHEDKTVGSPILKLLPAGARVEVIKQEATVSYVKDEQGTSGWVDNSYLSETAPADTAQDNALRERVAELEAKLAAATTEPTAGKIAKLEQQLKDERLRAGELQVQMVELRKHVGVTGSNEGLYKEISRLETDNKKLQAAVAAAGISADHVNAPDPEPARVPGIGTDEFIIGAIALLFIGCLVGAYLMDLRTRRRHGGFRI